MYARTKVFLIFLLILTLAMASPVLAQGDDGGDAPPCAGDAVSGTVVAVDEATGVVTVDTGSDLCTVVLNSGDYDHPIVKLLSTFFGDVSADSLLEALEATHGCVVQDPDDGTWTWADCEAEGAVEVTVTGENDDGTFTGVVTIDGEEMSVTVSVEDPEMAEGLSDALEALNVEWELDESGSVVQPGDEIAAYHDEGIGFGVLVKLYAMADASQKMCAAEDPTEPCGVTVEELVEAFQSGTGLGQLFKEYGKPSAMGVGHARKQWERARERVGPPDHAGPKDNENRPLHAGPPDHAGPKNNYGPPDYAGSNKPKREK